MDAIAKRADGLSLDRSGRPLIANLVARRRFDALLDDVSKAGAGGVLSAPRTSGGCWWRRRPPRSPNSDGTSQA
jgi:hypothetical protein